MDNEDFEPEIEYLYTFCWILIEILEVIILFIYLGYLKVLSNNKVIAYVTNKNANTYYI